MMISMTILTNDDLDDELIFVDIQMTNEIMIFK